MSEHSVIRASHNGSGDVPAAGAARRGPENGGPEVLAPRGANGFAPHGVMVEPPSDLQYYWRLIYGRRWLLLAAAACGLAVAAVVNFRQPRLYVAQATVEFKEALPPGKDLDILRRPVFIPPELARRLLTTKVLAARVIETERKRDVHWFDPASAADAPRSILGAVWAGAGSLAAATVNAVRLVLGQPPEKEAPAAVEDLSGVDIGTIGRYYSGIAIKPVRETSLVDIVVTHPDPDITARAANEHASAFIDMDIETKIASLSDAQGLVGRQLREVREQLETSRRALTDYQLEHGILSLPKNTDSLSRESLRQLNALFNKVQGERIVAEAAYRHAGTMSPEALAANLSNEGLEGVRSEILALEARYQGLLNDYGANHPDMISMRASIDALRERLRSAAVQVRQRMAAAFEAARTKEAQLRENLDALSRAASEQDRELVQLSILQRDVESNEQLYASLLDRAKEADLDTGWFRWTNVKLVDRAIVPAAPSFPRTRRNLLLGLFLGLAGGLLVCVLRERIDTSIHTPDDVVAILNRPSLGVIPDFRRLPARSPSSLTLLDPAQAEGTGREMVTLLQPASVVSEAYRSLRTHLMFSSPGGPPNTVLVTSSQMGEGKTVTVVNLAVTLTLSGARVLVIDGDLRKPSCHGALRVSREPGLSALLTGQCTMQDAVVRSPLSPQTGHSQNGHGLYVLPAGPVPPNPAELLGSEVMAETLRTLREQFDFILVDSPPLAMVTDSVVMATQTDAVLVVVRGGEWGREIIQRSLTQLDAVRARVLGVLLNCVDVTRGGSPYYYYRSYYGYGAYPGSSRAERNGAAAGADGMNA